MKTLRKSAAQVVVIGAFGILLAGCGGGSSSTTTVPPTASINGIAVPPEPDATQNNATIAGIDSNSNGVRDDVERYIATKFGDNKANFDVITIHASTEQAALISKEQKKIDAHINALACLGSLVKEASDVTKVALNTAERKKAYGDAFASVELKGCDK